MVIYNFKDELGLLLMNYNLLGRFARENPKFIISFILVVSLLNK